MLLILASLLLDFQQSVSEFAADMRFVVLLTWLLQTIVNGQSDPLTVIGAILDIVGIEYVPPPAATAAEATLPGLALT